jgi:hypothetical protein
MRIIPFAALGIAATFATACDSSVVDANDLAALNSAEARWNARPFADYSYEIRTSCFCPPEVLQWARVSIRGGTVVSVEAIDPDPAYPITHQLYWEPIDSLFAGLRAAMRDPSSDIYLEAIIVTYDPQLGYPTFIEYRAKRNVQDGGSVHTVRNVVPLE